MFSFGGKKDQDRGDQARDNRKWAEAARYYESHLRFRPDDFGIWVQCGHMHKEVGNFDRAEECYQAAENLRADDADLQLQRGHLCKLIGRLDDARVFYSRSLLLDATLEDAKRELELIAPPRSNVVEIAAESGETQPPSEANLVICVRDLDLLKIKERGARSLSDGRIVEAAQLFRVAVTLSPLDATVWKMLADALRQDENFANEAERCRLIASSLDPDASHE